MFFAESSQGGTIGFDIIRIFGVVALLFNSHRSGPDNTESGPEIKDIPGTG